MASNTTRQHHYRPTEAKYKSGAKEMSITYELEQHTRGGGTAPYPKVKRVYVPGDLKGWEVGTFEKKSGRKSFGVRVDYEQKRRGYHREGYTAHRGETTYQVPPTDVAPRSVSYSKVVELPEEARDIQLHPGKLPERYRDAKQSVR